MVKIELGGGIFFFNTFDTTLFKISNLSTIDKYLSSGFFFLLRTNNKNLKKFEPVYVHVRPRHYWNCSTAVKVTGFVFIVYKIVGIFNFKTIFLIFDMVTEQRFKNMFAIE